MYSVFMNLAAPGLWPLAGLHKTHTATLPGPAIVVAPCLNRLARPVAATNIEDAGRPRAISGQLSEFFLRDFFAQCKEVTEEKLIRG